MRQRITHLHVMVAAVAALGFALRLWYVVSPLGPPDSDESVVGLMAHRMLRGEFFTFYWGQHYGSTHEAGLVALALGLGIPTRLAMELVPALLTIAVVLLVWRVGVELGNRRAGVIAAALYWISSTAFVWNSTKERAFYVSMVVAGVAMLLFAIRLAAQVTRRDAVCFGLAFGSGWWASPQIIYLAIPIGLWLGWRLLHARDAAAVRHAPFAAGAAALGALPWIYSNVRDPLVSLRLAESVPDTTFMYRLGLFRVTAFPTALGAKIPLRGDWWGGLAGKVGFVVVVLLLALAFAALPAKANVVRLGLVMYPLIFAALPTSFYVGEPRYLALMWPLVTLLAGFGIVRLRWPFAQLTAVALVALITVGTTTTFIRFASRTPGLLDVSPGNLDPLMARLRAEGIERAFADYWVAHRIMLESNERVIAAPLQFIRNRDYERDVRTARKPAYVFFTGSCYDHQFRAYLDANAITYRSARAGGWSIVMPAHKVLPEDALIDWAGVRGLDPVQPVC